MVKSLIDRLLIVGIYSLCFCPLLGAADIPAGAIKYAPLLAKEQQHLWPDAPLPSFLAGQVEQESCITLKHPKCWNPRAELKTKRENGVGMGQFTRAYNQNGSIRFDTISDLAKRYDSLHGWSWARRYDPDYQLRAIVEMDHGLYVRQKTFNTPSDRLAFALSAYNGGEGGVLQDQRLCHNTHHCNPGIWFGNVERTSLKSRTPHKGYGQSFFQINRDYVQNVINVRRHKYEQFFNKE